MIELVEYRIVYKRPEFTKEEGNDALALNAKWNERLTEVCDYVLVQAALFDAAAANENEKSHLTIDKGASGVFSVLNVRSSAAFKDFLKDQQHELIPVVEASSGMQLMVMAAFVPCPHQSNVGWGIGNTPLLSEQFHKVSYGVPPGKALTQVESDARIEMNDRLFGKLTRALEGVKQRHGDYLMEIREKQLGSFFVCVTSQGNQENGVSRHDVCDALRPLTEDSDVSAVLVGPYLYPSDVAKRVQENKAQPRKPKNLDI